MPSTYNERGEEIVNPEPGSLHVKFRRAIPLAERVKTLIRQDNLRHLAEVQGIDTFDEADDFNIEDDPIDPATPYEENFEPTVPGITARMAEVRAGLVEDVGKSRLLKAKEVFEKWGKAKQELIWLAKKKKAAQDAENAGKSPETVNP